MSLPLSLSQMLGANQWTIDDQVLLSFLTAPADGDFHDPGGVVPPRWRAMPPEQRRGWLLDAFSLLLKAGSDRKEPVCVVAEPGVAALVFYGIARLMPAGPLRDGVTASPCEPDPAKAGAALAGVWPASPETAGDPAGAQGDLCPGCTLVVDTRQEPAADAERPRSQYAVAMVRRAAEKGWEQVDWQLETVGSVKPKKIEQLEMIATADRLVVAVLQKGSFPSQNWRKSLPMTMCVRKVLVRYLTRQGDLAPRLKAVLGGSAHLSVLDLLAPVKDPKVRPVMEVLLDGLPGEKFASLLKLKTIGQADKLRALVHYVETKGSLPPNCDSLWEAWAKGLRTGNTAKMGLLPHLLTKLGPQPLANLFKSLPQSRAIEAVVGLLQLRAGSGLKSAFITPVVVALDEAALVALLRSKGPKFLEDYPGDEPGMARQLGQILRSLPHHPEEFKDRLDWCLAGQHLLDERDQRAVEAWAKCRNGIVEVGRLQEAESGGNEQTRLNRLVDAARNMAMAADEAMSYSTFESDTPHVKKQQALRQIGQELLGKPLLPPGAVENEFLWNKIAQQFQTHQWPVEGPVSKETMRAETAAVGVGGKPGAKPAPGKPGGKKEPAKKETGKDAEGTRLVGPGEKSLSATPRWVMWLTILAILALSVGVFALVWWIFFGKKPPSKTHGGKRERQRIERPGGAAPAEPEAQPKAGEKRGGGPHQKDSIDRGI